MLNKENIKGWLDYLKSKNTSDSSIKTYRQKVEKLLTYGNDFSQAMETFFVEYASNKSDATKRISLASFNSFQDYLINEKGMIHPIDINWKYKPNRVNKKAIKPFMDDEIEKILNLELYDSPSIIEKYKLKLALTILIKTGIRISEFTYFNNLNELNEKEYIEVYGKSKSSRLIWISPEIKKQAKNIYELIIRKSSNSRDITSWWYENYNTQYKVIKKHCSTILNRDEITPHTFRHTFATNWINQGFNLYDLKEVLGHDSIATTEIYLTKNVKRIMDSWKRFDNGDDTTDIKYWKARAIKAERRLKKYE